MKGWEEFGGIREGIRGFGPRRSLGSARTWRGGRSSSTMRLKARGGAAGTPRGTREGRGGRGRAQGPAQLPAAAPTFVHHPIRARYPCDVTTRAWPSRRRRAVACAVARETQRGWSSRWTRPLHEATPPPAVSGAPGSCRPSPGTSPRPPRPPPRVLPGRPRCLRPGTRVRSPPGSCGRILHCQLQPGAAGLGSGGLGGAGPDPPARGGPCPDLDPL